MFQYMKKSIKNRFVTKIVVTCMLTAALLIFLQTLVTTIYVVKYQQKQAVDSSLQTLSVASEYFSNLYADVKTFNKSLYKEKTIRNQMASFMHGDGTPTATGKLSFSHILSEQLVKIFGSDFGALIEASYYDIASETQISFYWNEAAQGREAYMYLAIDEALEMLQTNPSKQRMYEFAVLTDEPTENMFALYDFVRDPNDLTKVKGILIFYYATDKITQKLYEIGFTDEMEVIVLTQSEKLCYDSFHNFTEAADRFEGKSLVPGVYMEDGVYVVEKNSRFGFCVVSTMTHSALYGSVYRMLAFVSLCTVTVLIMLLIFLCSYDRRFSERLMLLAKDVSKIEAGRLDITLFESDNHDEVDLFAHNLNEMQMRLSQQIIREQQSMERVWKLELMQKDAEFYALHAQIKPHFLFNTLEIIRMRAVAEHAIDTASMVALFADVIRRKVDRTTVITYLEEVDYCNKYIELFSYRYNGELLYKLQIDPSIRQYYLPTYVLQPVIENALIHGLHSDMEDPCLAVMIRQDADSVEIKITDNGSGMDEDTLMRLKEKLACDFSGERSIGIVNVSNRLRLLFGKHYSMQFDSKTGAGTTVILRIPVIESMEAWEAYVQSGDR